MLGTSVRHGIISFLLLAVFGSYCQMAPAAAGKARQFELGLGQAYRFESTVLLNEGGPKIGKDVGFQISGGLAVGAIWEDPSNALDKLLSLELSSPVLHIKSRKAPAPEGFVAHASKLEKMKNGAFYVHWIGGKIEHIYVGKDEEHSMINLKKGLASLFQFQLLDTEISEKDASGKCLVTYTSIDSHTILKTKTSCVTGKMVPFISHPDKILGTDVTSKRNVTYTLSRDMSALHSIVAEESHEMAMVMRRDASTSVRATQEITNTGDPVALVPINAESIEKAIQSVEKSTGDVLNKQILVPDREASTCTDDCPSLHKLVKDNHDILKNDNLGTIRSASAFIRLLNTARGSTKDQILKVLSSSKNKDIILQLADLAGAAQTREAHAAIMSVIKLDSDEDLDLAERYFLALSLGSHPVTDVIKDVLKLLSKDNIKNEKLQETLVLTVAAMTNKLKKLPGNDQHKIIGEVKESLIHGLKKCSSEECKQKYLRGLKNLGLAETIPTLLGHSLTGSRKTSVCAMKALRSLPVDTWDESVKNAATKIYYQIGKRFDSSSRTLALDILLESGPSREVLRGLLWSLRSNDPAFEVKQYLLQRLRQIAERNLDFGNTVLNIVRGEKLLNNYDVLGQRGLTTAFTRPFMSSPSGNGSLVTIQEISSGLLKRGIVDIILDNSGYSQELFSLGLFAGGLGSFISSDDSEAEPEEPEESATAGMEITALGVQVRPFVFFSGQGELMGHVWSGAGSEKTPAFQTLALLQDHLQYIPLQTGYIAELTLLGAISFDLSGQIQLSLWNRNAHALVEKNAGLSIQGLMKVDTSFVRSQVEFNIATEAKLNLVSDIDFYSNIALCMQLKQPDSILKHNVHKVERIPGSKHRLRKSKYRVFHVSGKTYALNQKNNEMCNIIFK